MPSRSPNTTGCVIKVSPANGRGVYAAKAIPRDTTIEISPVLFDEQHGRLDHCTFRWPDGRMALALGLSSLFNHSDPPNVTYAFDTTTDSIQYITTRDISPGEELCIFYDHKLWCRPAGVSPRNNLCQSPDVYDDGSGGLSLADYDGLMGGERASRVSPLVAGDPAALVPEEDLPFRRYKLPPEEEDPESIRTTQAWVVDVPDPRLITTLLKWLKQSNLDTVDLAHLKRVRKQGDATTFLLATQSASPMGPPLLPEALDLPLPYLHTVPVSSALTLTQLALKTPLWPTTYTPRKKDELEEWSRGKVYWAWLAMRETVRAAIQAHRNGELPIVAHIPAPYEEALFSGIQPEKSSREPVETFTAHDTRTSTNHPLRHAVINVIRNMADHHASTSIFPRPAESTDAETETPTLPEEGDGNSSAAALQNGSNYLLTSRYIFTTHEPCIMCSMALLHSRVKEIIYLLPMPHTGGCGGGITCLPRLKGVNHRFSISQWRRDKGLEVEGAGGEVDKILNIETTIDV